MKESVLDVLLYLFENYMDEEVHVDYDQETLKTELSEAGFSRPEINKAFAWLEGLTDRQHGLTMPQGAGSAPLRVYTALEMDKLDTECRGFLLFLEQLGVLDAVNREIVIDRVMALEDEEISLDQLKWVTLMVLFNQPGQEAAITWMEDLLYDELPGNLH